MVYTWPYCITPDHVVVHRSALRSAVRLAILSYAWPYWFTPGRDGSHLATLPRCGTPGPYGFQPDRDGLHRVMRCYTDPGTSLLAMLDSAWPDGLHLATVHYT